MTLSAQAREYMDKHSSLSDEEKLVIYDAFTMLLTALDPANLPAAGDDRAAELEAAMIKFIIDSRK